MRSRPIDPMRVDPNQLSRDELIVHFEVLRERFRHEERELDKLRRNPFGRRLIKMVTTVLVSVLILFSGLLYTYAINKLTVVPADAGATNLLYFAIGIYIISIVLQMINAGGR